MSLRYICIKSWRPLAWLMIAGLLLGTSGVAAQGLSLQQRILMPGPLTQQHAEYESDCENCHSPFEREEMTSRCLVCHEDVAEDRTTGFGFHGQNLLAAREPCESCHTDHEGRDFSIAGLLPDTFDHQETRFPLQGAHTDASCADCHSDGQSFRNTGADCLSCHEDQDVHGGALDQSCETCHQSSSWQQLLAFDHAETAFVLEGGHAEVACTSCHLGQLFTFEQIECVTCHAVADVHGGVYGDKCDGCHVAQGWNEVTFSHDETGFPLEGAHENIDCVSCHDAARLTEPAVPSDPLQASGLPQLADFAAIALNATRTCIDCHADNDLHFGRFGSDCASCHLSGRWEDLSFEHDTDTGYVLTGSHATADCSGCHAGLLTEPVSPDCVTCHLAQDIHQDPEMQSCETCHNTESWDSTQAFDHDFTGLPLLGMHLIAPCESCHIQNQMNNTDSSCVSCHQADDFHQRSVGEACGDCHTPNGWELWQFDHGVATDYSLQGSHDGLSCNSCHLADTSPAETADQCGSCHLSDDVHRGEFGTSCDQCHSTTDFSEVFLSGRRL